MANTYTNKLNLAKPARRDTDWDDENNGNFDILDAAVYANREDRNLTLTGGGTLLLNIALGQVSFTSDLKIHHGSSTFVTTIPATESPLLFNAAYKLAYVTIPRSPTSSTSLTRGTSTLYDNATTVPSTNSNLLIAIRDANNQVKFFDGTVLQDGVATTLGGGGGGGPGPQGAQGAQGAQGSGEFNFVSPADAETAGQDLLWSVYNDNSAIPVNGTGMAPAPICAWFQVGGQIRGTSSFIYTGGNVGNGVKRDFTIQDVDRGKLHKISFLYKPIAGVYTPATTVSTGTFGIYIYDITNNVFLETDNYTLSATSGSFDHFEAKFVAASNSSNYRVMIHQFLASVASSTAFDNIKIAPYYDDLKKVNTFYSGPVVLTYNNDIALIDASGSTVNVILPSPIGKKGKTFTVKKIDTTANEVIISSFVNVDGSLSPVYLYSQNEARQFVSDGYQYFMIPYSDSLNTRYVNSSQTLSATDGFIQADSSVSNIILTLPPPYIVRGQTFIFKKISASNTVTIASTANIDGLASIAVFALNDVRRIISSGFTYYII